MYIKLAKQENALSVLCITTMSDDPLYGINHHSRVDALDALANTTYPTT